MVPPHCKGDVDSRESGNDGTGAYLAESGGGGGGPVEEDA